MFNAYRRKYKYCSRKKMIFTNRHRISQGLFIETTSISFMFNVQLISCDLQKQKPGNCADGIFTLLPRAILTKKLLIMLRSQFFSIFFIRNHRGGIYISRIFLIRDWWWPCRSYEDEIKLVWLKLLVLCLPSPETIPRHLQSKQFLKFLQIPQLRLPLVILNFSKANQQTFFFPCFWHNQTV